MKLNRNVLRKLILQEMAQFKDGSYDDSVAPYDYELQGAAIGREGYADMSPLPDENRFDYEGAEYMGMFLSASGKPHRIFRDEGGYILGSTGDVYPSMEDVMQAIAASEGPV